MGIFRDKLTLPSLSAASPKESSSWVNASITAKTVSSGDHQLDHQLDYSVFAETNAESGVGWLAGPFVLQSSSTMAPWRLLPGPKAVLFAKKFASR